MKTALVTGGTAGIGKVTATELARQNYRVIITGRNKEKAETTVEEIKSVTANPHIHYLLADMVKLNEVRQMASEFLSSYDALHLLINNAGGVYMNRELTIEGYEKTFVNNHLAHFLLTNELLPLMKKSAPARIINVSSIAHFEGKWVPNDIHFAHKYKVLWAYANSKLHNVLFTKYLAEQVKNDGITVNCLHPGVVKTNIGGKNTNWLGGFLWNLFTVFKGISEAEGAKTSLYLATSPEVDKITGKYFDKCKETPSSQISNNFAAAEELWQMSEDMCRLSQQG